MYVFADRYLFYGLKATACAKILRCLNTLHCNEINTEEFVQVAKFVFEKGDGRRTAEASELRHMFIPVIFRWITVL